MIGLIPAIVAGGVVKKFSEGMLSQPKKRKASKPKRKSSKVTNPLSSRYSPF